MKHSQKSSAPISFTNWIASASSDWVPSYDDLRSPERPSVISSLLKEQGYVCAYCGRGLKDDGSDAHIDHYWPQAAFGPNSNSDRSLDYDNFFLSCGPNRHPLGHSLRLPVTCGEAKGDRYDVDHYIIPSDPNCENNFKYGTLGTIVAKPGGNKAAENMIQWLNLSDKSLEYERQQLLSGVELQISSGEITDSNKQEFIAIWRSHDASGRLKKFGHTAASYIEEEI